MCIFCSTFARFFGRMGLKPVQALKTFEKICKDIPDQHYDYTLYLCKGENKLYYETKNSYLHTVELANINGKIGFFIYELTKKDSFIPTGKDLWWELEDDFYSVVKGNAINKFYDEVLESVAGMRVKSEADKLRVYEKIKSVFDSYKK